MTSKLQRITDSAWAEIESWAFRLLAAVLEGCAQPYSKLAQSKSSATPVPHGLVEEFSYDVWLWWFPLITKAP